jgi:hypothetical protein
MDELIALWATIVANIKPILNVVAYLIAAASIIVKLTPTLKDDAYLKTIIKFIGKYIALDKYGPPSS